MKTVIIGGIEAEKKGNFGKKIASLKPDIVIDMICFEPESAVALVEALRGRVSHYLSCGTIWVHGSSEQVPTTEDHPRNPFGDYGVRKAKIEAFLLDEARRTGFPATILHPGWAPLNPAGNFSTSVFERIAHGEPLTLPNLGLETVHHVHADDVAQSFMKSIASWSAAVGESFHVASPKALTLRGYAEVVYSFFGRKADIRFLPWEEWRNTVSRGEAEFTWDHIAHSPCMSIAKASRLIGYSPRYTSLEAVRESVFWLIENDVFAVK